MSRLRLGIVGSGQRVVETALPVLRSVSERVELAGLFSRKAKTIEASGAHYDVEPLDALDARRMAELDALYLVVSKPAVPKVLARLAALDPSKVALLIETPVVLIRHLHQVRPLASFRSASVTEDCLTLPLIDAARACIDSGALGDVREVTLDRSAYAYHGIAMLKALLGDGRVRSARRTADGADGWRREYRFRSGRVGRTVDPRDYSRGRLWIRGSEATLADHGTAGPSLSLQVELDGKQPTAFRAGDAVRRLEDVERSLMGNPKDGDSPWAWMDGMKRVGFRKLLLGLADGQQAYPVLNALDDALVDYHLEKLNRYVANPLTSARGLTMGWLGRGIRPARDEWPPVPQS